MDKQKPRESRNRIISLGGAAVAAAALIALAIGDARNDTNTDAANVVNTASDDGFLRMPPKVFKIDALSDDELAKILNTPVDPRLKFPETILEVKTISLSQVQMLKTHKFAPREEFHVVIEDPNVLAPEVRAELQPYFDDREGDPAKNFTFWAKE